MTDPVSKQGELSPQTITLTDKASDKLLLALEPLVAEVRDRFTSSKSARLYDEQRWAQAYYNFRGKAGSDKFVEGEISQAFIKITKVKVLAGHSLIMDVLTANGTFPITVDPTPDPLGIKESVHVSLADPVDKGAPPAPDTKGFHMGFPGDGDELKPGETVLDRVGSWLKNKLTGAKVQDGEGLSPQDVTYHPAMIAAKKMEKRIHDQLEETNFFFALQQMVFELCLYGTGVIKGPFAEEKEYPRWNDKQEYDPVIKLVPSLEFVSIWDIYGDPEARGRNDADFIIQRHRLTRSQLLALKKRPHFRDTAIDDASMDGPNFTPEWFENEIGDNKKPAGPTLRYEVLEYWGNASREMLEETNVPLPSSMDDVDEFQVNIWICGEHLLRVVLNPFQPHRIPFHIIPYEVNPYSMYGVGVAENMQDPQRLMNGFVRLAVDNAALAGSMVFEVDETNLVPGQDMKIYTGKIFRRQGGPPGQAIFSHKFQSTAQDNMLMYDKFRMFADEATGIPSYAHGQTGVQSNVSRTAAGTSMMMSAAGAATKSVIQNIDEYGLGPMGKDFFAFNMQFDPDPDIKGDLEVTARGAAGLMQKEVQSQRLIQYLQVLSNPMLAPFGKFPYIIKEIAKNMDLDPDKVTNSMEEAKLQAMLLQMSGGMSGAPSAPADAGAQTGGGGIGSTGAPQPGTPQFSGNQPSPSAAPSPMPPPGQVPKAA